MRAYTIYRKNIATIFRHYRTVPGFFSEIRIYFFTGRKKSRVGTKVVGRVRLPEPHNFFLALPKLCTYPIYFWDVTSNKIFLIFAWRESRPRYRFTCISEITLGALTAK